MRLPRISVAWRMVALAFLAQNCALGIAVGSYGTIILSLEEQFDVSRGMSSMGIGLLGLAVGAASPLVGLWLRKRSVRTAMVAGAVVNAVAYLILAMAGNIYAFLAIFGLMVGIGNTLVGIVTPATLVSRWFEAGRARALAIVGAPVFLLFIPFLSAAVISAFSMRVWFLCAAVVFALLAPLLLFVVDHPPAAAPNAGATPGNHGSAADAEPLTMRALAARVRFWLLTLGIAAITAASNAFLTHVVPYAKSEGIALQSAASLVSAFGAAGVVGTLLFGVAADRIGVTRMIMINALLQALLWILLVGEQGLIGLLILSGAMGVTAISTIALHGAALCEVFGPKNVSAGIGLGYFIKLPFIFGAAPFCGYLFDMTGDYDAPFAIISAMLLAAAASCALLLFLSRKQDSEENKTASVAFTLPECTGLTPAQKTTRSGCSSGKRV